MSAIHFHRSDFFAVCGAAASVLLASPSARADTSISGSIQGSLSLSGSPYLVTSRLTVPAGASLTIDAGVQMKFQDRVQMFVNGSLVANGTAAAPIVFTSSTGTTSGRWAGIGVQPGGAATFAHVKVSAAGLAGGFPIVGQLPRSAALFCYRGSLSVANSEISASGGDGVYYLNDMSPGQSIGVNNCSLFTIAGDGVHLEAIEPDDSLSVDGNTVSGCGSFPFRIPASAMGKIGAANAMSGNASGNGIALSAGSISGTVILTPNRSWFVLGQITVPVGASLNLVDGDTLRFRAGVKLQVAGSLSATASPFSPVGFIADSAAQTPASRWAGIELDEGASATLSSAVISGAGFASSFQIPGTSDYRTASIFAYRADLTLNAASIISGGGDGLYWYNDSIPHLLNVQSSSINATDNDGYVVAWETAADTVSLTSNTVVGVQRYPIVVPSRRLVGLHGNAITVNAIPAVGISGGAVESNTSLDAGGLYHVLQTVSVSTGVTLTIGAGAALHFAPDSWLDVFGSFVTQGTALKPVTLTSFWPTPLPGDWGGVGLEPGSSATLAYTSVRYGGQDGAFLVAGVGAIQAGVLVNRASLSATGLSCDHTNGEGVFVYNPAAPARSVTLTGGTYTANSGDGVHVHQSQAADTISLTGLNASGNTGDGVQLMDVRGLATVASLVANSNGAYPMRCDAAMLGGISEITFSGNTAGDHVALTGGTIAGAVSVGFPVRLLDKVDVPSGASLEFLPGADVTGDPLSGLQVEGSLSAHGLATAPIAFHGPTVAQRGAWGGIGVLAGGSLSLSNARVDNAGEPGDFYVPLHPNSSAAVLVYRGLLSITDSSIGNSGSDGIAYVNDGGTAKSLAVERVAVSHAVAAGINVTASGPNDTVSVASNTVTDCGSVGVVMPMQSLYGLGAGGSYSGNAGGDGVRATANTTDAGTLSRNATVSANGTLFVPATVAVAAGANLVLSEGVTLKMGGGASLLVSGSLTAQGTAESPVLFTADAALPTPGTWGGVGFAPGSTGALAGAELRYGGASSTLPGGTNATASLVASDANVTLTGSLLRDGIGALLFLRGGNLIFTATKTTFVDNASGPHVRLVDAGGTGAISFGGAAVNACDFLSVQNPALSNTGPATVSARYCYWDASDGPQPLGGGAGTSGAFDTTPFVSSAVNSPRASLLIAPPVPHGLVSIVGTAYSPYFQSALLEVGAGSSPATYTTLASLTSTVSGGTIGVWDTTALADGAYTLRLTVTDRLGRVARASVLVTLGTGAAGSGDLSGNGTVDVFDAVLALRMASGLQKASLAARAAGDVRPKPGNGVPYGDGLLAMDDVVAILRKALDPGMSWP